MTTLSGQGRRAVSVASRIKARPAQHNGFRYGRKSGRKHRTQPILPSRTRS